jgi:uncharacterized protein
MPQTHVPSFHYSIWSLSPILVVTTSRQSNQGINDIIWGNRSIEVETCPLDRTACIVRLEPQSGDHYFRMFSKPAARKGPCLRAKGNAPTTALSLNLPQKVSMHKEQMIAQTKKWILEVVVGCNFCPFALREVKKDTITFEVIEGNRAFVLNALTEAFQKMNRQPEVETMFLLLPQNFARFADYLKLVHAAEALIKKEGYEGIYQVASFHPSYLFAGSSINDAANYTNRSPYPMLHLLREESLSRAIDSYPDTQKIPERNTAFARGKGLAYMQRLRAACLDIP